MSDDPTRLVGEDRCWPCTVANTAVAALVAGVPLLAAVLSGEPVLVGVAALWAVAVCLGTGYHLLDRGYLPGAERVARRTGLHDRIGPGRTADGDEGPEPPGGGPA